MELLLATQQSGILMPFAWILGKILEAIYFIFSSIGIESIGLCIIVFTVVIRMLMLPSTIKQQKFSKLNSVMNPEIQAIQKKYKNKVDQASQLAQQEEIKAVYDKYGVSPTGSCLQLLIQMPIILALYRVIMNIPAYVSSVKDYYLTILQNMNGSQIKEFFTYKVDSFSDLTTQQVNNCIDVMSGYNRATLKVDGFSLSKLVDTIDSSVVDKAYDHIHNINNFFCYNLSDSPSQMLKAGLPIILVLLIPVLAGLTQFLSVTLSMKLNSAATNTQDNPMAGSMKMMNIMMPLMSVYMCYMFASGIGIYWVTSSAAMMIQQIFINMHLKKMDVNEIIEKNKEKAEQKRIARNEKNGVYREQVLKAASTNTKSVSSKANSTKSFAEKEKIIEEAKMKNMKKKNGSIGSRVNMVNDFNERNKK
ncbi:MULTISPECIES: YidC/Oxa1 family membrane protein insertase [Eubacterium]|uniref:YidC/Oxa1 family membrane protein insertase n=1 Tax=Eubacterium album TaxID=2978477 RepID=A0ABT2LZE3_9FIRM|nr:MULTISPECIES: YidC/Oxa1 family membrane protein insertase [unclassified Eubacterium (in: firmicutes)]MCT7398644.1 YidC/Oxa1 family membrane protein insertase [Eubacterium sp. LFL-14]RGG64293.1 membrane protein insertase YidC [Eubacterium sp. AF17-7]RHR32218.1 membrane protein insertase YidC [Eubacterium sp. AF19-12LB]CDA28078.1 membrane protein insertase YidC/Oxa1 family [Eubacterium sp. CAG:156]